MSYLNFDDLSFGSDETQTTFDPDSLEDSIFDGIDERHFDLSSDGFSLGTEESFEKAFLSDGDEYGEQ